jgi:transmembrane sensor
MRGDDLVRDRAAHFVARMDADDWAAADEAALQTWLAEDPLREGLLLQIQAQWLALSPPASNVAQSDTEPPAVYEPSKIARRGILVSIAATAAAIVAGVRLNGGPSEYTTRVGEIRRLPLPDGSVVTINSGSNVTVAMAERTRAIELAEGEAWFEVAKDARRPFVVAAGDVRVRAVGTAFSVRRRESGVEVQVTEGVVETWSDYDHTLRVRLSAGDRVTLTARAVVDYETGVSTAVDRSLAWRSGMIDLNGRSLADAAAEFNRYNARQIIIADPEIAREELSGLFNINDPEGFARTVEASLGVKVDSSASALIKIE